MPSCLRCCRQVASRCLRRGLQAVKMPSWAHLGPVLGSKMGILHRRGCIFQHVAFSLLRSRKIAQDGPRWPKLGPTWPQHGPKMAPRRPQDGPKTVPRRLRDASLTKSKIQAGLKMAQVASNLPLTCHLASDVAGKLPQEASEEGFRPSRCHLGFCFSFALALFQLCVSFALALL